jgi:hypothetical protein
MTGSHYQSARFGDPILADDLDAAEIHMFENPLEHDGEPIQLSHS